MNSLAALAQRLDARDLFVLHRVAEDRVVNVDGHGRGAGWAGNVAIDPTCEPFISAAFDADVVRVDYGYPRRLFGPYWADDAVAVRVGGDVVIVAGPGVNARSDETIREVAAAARALAQEVPVAKRLADELEVTQAALGVASLRPRTVEEAGAAIAERAAAALSCEFGAVVVEGPPLRLLVAAEGWQPAATADEVIAALAPLRSAGANGLYVEQDLGTSPLAYPPLSRDDGLAARCTARIGSEDAPLGWLVVAHAGTAPRGFTDLCQQVARKVAEAAAPVLRDVLERDPASA